MVIFKREKDLKRYLLDISSKGKGVGFVPTMGALHKGHLSLLKEAQNHCDCCVVSIFVNPTQFNDKEDYEKYPVDTSNDTLLLTDSGCNVLFLPEVDEVYPNGVENTPVYDFGYLETILEGKYRQGHFKGVGQVVARLLDMVQPHKLFLGQKDYQQCMVLKSLVEQIELKPEIVICSTQREDDGLAMSSRNRRLTPQQRAIAGLLYQCLVSIKTKSGIERFSIVEKECHDILKEKGFEPEYVALADANDLTLLEDYDPNREMVALIVASIGGIRLIDNMLI